MKATGQAPAAISTLPTGEILRGGIEIIDRVEDEWRALCATGRYAEPFYRPEMIRAYMRAFAPGQNLLIATARVAGRLVAILPLLKERGSFAGLPAHKLRAPANVHTCRFDLVHGGVAEDLAVTAIWRALKAARGWDLLELTNVPHGGGVRQLVRLARDDGHPAGVLRGDPSPRVLLPTNEGAFEALIKRTDRKFRTGQRRRMRKLQEEHGAVRHVSSQTVDEKLERFYELERSGWKGREGSAIACSETTRQFYDEVARESARFGYFRLDVLECAERPVAMHYSFEYNGRYFLLKSAYDESLGNCSPGQLLIQEVLAGLTTRNFVELDMLGVFTEAKRDWVPGPRPHADYYVFSRAPLGRLLHAMKFRVRPALKRVLRKTRKYQ